MSNQARLGPFSELGRRTVADSRSVITVAQHAPGTPIGARACRDITPIIRIQARRSPRRARGVTGAFLKIGPFTDAPIWTATVLDELDERFNRHPDNSKDRFQVKLKRQLAEASPHACHLAAEMLWVMSLFPSNIGPDAKRSAIREAWSWSGEELPQDHPLLDRELLRGLGSAGPGFL